MRILLRPLAASTWCPPQPLGRAEGRGLGVAAPAWHPLAHNDAMAHSSLPPSSTPAATEFSAVPSLPGLLCLPKVHVLTFQPQSISECEHTRNGACAGSVQMRPYSGRVSPWPRKAGVLIGKGARVTCRERPAEDGDADARCACHPGAEGPQLPQKWGQPGQTLPPGLRGNLLSRNDKLLV